MSKGIRIQSGMPHSPCLHLATKRPEHKNQRFESPPPCDIINLVIANARSLLALFLAELIDPLPSGFIEKTDILLFLEESAKFKIEVNNRVH